MQIPTDVVERMLIVLRSTPNYANLPVTSRPMTDLWHALNTCLLALRLPLYHKRLVKKPPRAAMYDDAVQRALALLLAFAVATDVKQAIVSTSGGWARSISFQPRPYNMNWTAQYAITPAVLTREDGLKPYLVTVEDILHLAAKAVHAASFYNAGEIPDVTATFVFHRADGHTDVRLVVCEQATGAWSETQLLT